GGGTPLAAGRLPYGDHGRADVLERLGLQRQHRHVRRQTPDGLLHLRVGDCADLAELLGHYQIGLKRAQLRLIEVVDARALVAGAADVCVDLARGRALGGKRTRGDAGQAGNVLARVVALVGDSDDTV